MKKLHILLFVLSLCFLFAGCNIDVEDKTVSVSGDFAYYAEMDAATLKEKCEGNYLEVSGTVYTIYQYIGTVYLGNNLSDKIQFSCDLSDPADATNIEKGDSVTIRGKCSSLIGSTIYLQNCEIQKNTSQTQPTSTVPMHTHSFQAATCTEPKTCSCGATEGTPNGHTWKEATCLDPKTCVICSKTSGLAMGHDFANGKCITCGKEDTTISQENMVWIPTHGGTKYHSHSGCSNMEDPEYVTQDEAESRGFTRCQKCH